MSIEKPLGFSKRSAASIRKTRHVSGLFVSIFVYFYGRMVFAAHNTRAGFAKTCLIIIIAILFIIGLLVAFFFRIPQKLMPSPAKKLLNGTPYRAEAALVLQEAATSGMSTEGVSLHILPIKGTNQTVAYAILDASQGFTFQRLGGLDPVSSMMSAFLTGNQAQQMNIKQVSIDYHNDEGKQLFVASAPARAILSFINGDIDQDAFAAQLDGDVNGPNFLTGEWDTITSVIK